MGLFALLIESVLKKDENYYPQVFLLKSYKELFFWKRPALLLFKLHDTLIPKMRKLLRAVSEENSEQMDKRTDKQTGGYFMGPSLCGFNEGSFI